MSNPNFPPEVSTKVSLVNFTITSESLEVEKIILNFLFRLNYWNYVSQKKNQI